MTVKTVGVAITQWNHSSLTIDVFDALVSIDQLKHIAIVDNGSHAEELSALQQHLKQHQWARNDISVYLIENAVNSGFSGGNNLAISKLLELDCDWIWLLNNDCVPSLVNQQGFRNLIDHAQPAIYGSSIRTAAGSVFSGFYRFNFLFAKHSEILSQSDFNDTAEKNKYLSGANMLVHRSVFEKVGLLNPRTFLYYEELDFVYRAKVFGFSQKMSLDFQVFHHEAGSTNNSRGSYAKYYSEIWSNLDFYKAHKPQLFLFMLLLRIPLKLLFNLICFKKDKFCAVLCATRDYLKNHNSLKKEAQVRRVQSYH